MLELIADNMALFWVVLVVLFALVEALTAGLTCIWFGIGSAAALVSAFFDAAIWLQFVWFFVISIASLVRKYVDAEKQPTNADMVIGRVAIVTEAIDNLAPTGAVTVGGKVWTARSADGSRIEERCIVVVRRIEGVKLIVEPATGADLNIIE